MAETSWKVEFEKNIQQLRQNANIETLFSKVLEKTIYDKARDKMKQGKKNEEEETQKEGVKDILAPILKKLGFAPGKELNEEAAIMVKNEALRNLKERLLTRAEIIQRRLEEEQKALEAAYVRKFQTLIKLFSPILNVRVRTLRRKMRNHMNVMSKRPTLRLRSLQNVHQLITSNLCSSSSNSMKNYPKILD